MDKIQEQLNIIKNILMTQDNILIINTIENINPIILMYYQMIDNTFEYYTNKLPKEYFNFDIDDAIDMFIDIDDMDFIIYIIEKFNFLNPQNIEKGEQIIKEMCEYYIDDDDIDNLNIIYAKFKSIPSSLNISKIILNYCYRNNKTNIIEIYLRVPENKIEYEEDPYVFNGYMCSLLMTWGDYVDTINVLYKYSQEYPALLNFDFDIVFNSALVGGRYKCMHYALNHSTIDYYCKDETNETYSIEFDIIDYIYPITDSIMYAIIGKNINCFRTVFDMFKDKLKECNWEHYFKFASVYGTLEIIQYMIIMKPYIVDKIEDFYNNILKFALCEGNIDIVKFAIINGANYSPNMIEFVNDYNNGRDTDYDGVAGDITGFYDELYHCPDDLDERIMKCMHFIHN